MGIKFKEQQEKSKIMLMAILLVIACFLTYYDHVVLRTGAVFTHFFYIPIILASLWWQRKGIVVAVFLATLLILSHIFLRLDVETANDFLRAPMFLVISIVVATLSERIKKREKTIRESELRFRNLIENSLTGFSIIQDNRVVYQNLEQQKLFGPLPRPPKLTDYKSIHLDDVKKVKKFYEDITSENFQTLDTDFRFYPPGKIDRKADMKWVHCRAILINYQGKKARLVNMTDITKIKEMEHLLRIQDKMTSLGRVAAGIAHEIRNPLSGINVYLNTLHKIYDKEESLDKVKRIIEQLQSASNKIKAVIKRVMDFSKPSVPKFVLTDINQPIEEALKLSLVSMRKSGITIEKALFGDLPLCQIDPHLIEEAILNLITNATEALKNVEGPKRIEVSSSVKDNRLLVRVSDSGPGVPLNLKDQIFDPFYTTKGGGTGIGLSICHRIITDHGGSLHVSTSKWGGAEFMIEIPIKKE